MSYISELLRFGGSFQRALILNALAISLVYFMSDAGGLDQASDYAYYKILGACRAGSWVTPPHAISIVISMCISAIAVIVFVVCGRFSAEELKQERNGTSVSMVCLIVAAFAIYMSIFYLPCGIFPHRGDPLVKVQIGAAIFNYARTNFFVFLVLLTSASTGFFYTAALGIKLITKRM